MKCQYGADFYGSTALDLYNQYHPEDDLKLKETLEDWLDDEFYLQRVKRVGYI